MNESESRSISELVRQLAGQLEAREQANAEARKKHERRIAELEEELEEVRAERDQLERQLGQAAGANDELRGRLEDLQRSVQEDVAKWSGALGEIIEAAGKNETGTSSGSEWGAEANAPAGSEKTERLREVMTEVSEELKSVYLLLQEAKMENGKKGEILSILQYMDILLQEDVEEETAGDGLEDAGRRERSENTSRGRPGSGEGTRGGPSEWPSPPETHDDVDA